MTHWKPTDPVVITEPGSTHEGRQEACEKHIVLSAWANAQAIKFQWVSNALRLAQQRGAMDYLASYKKLEFPVEWHEDFQRRAHDLGLLYGCSIYCAGDVELIAPYVDFFKISSFEAAHPLLLDQMVNYHKPIYISLGMRDQAEVESLQNRIGLPRVVNGAQSDIRFLYCVSSYPCPREQLNLAVLTTGLYDGYSDHSADVTVGARAYAAGARYIEVHTRLVDTPPTNADFGVSLQYHDLQKYTRLIRDQQIYFGSSKRVVQPSEEPYRQYQYQ